jgi:putative SOS response-associated peptidase YedK
MLLACLWDRWSAPGRPDLYSFAAITDEPPLEVAATAHERCVIPIDPANVDAWLTSEGCSKDELYAILDQRERPHYEHRIASRQA